MAEPGRGDATAPRSLLALSDEELAARVAELGGRPFHARVARRELVVRGVLEYAAMSALPRPLRESLESEVPLLSGRVLGRRRARDGTTKLLIGFPPRAGREARIETVHMPARRSAGATLCVSTQAGCPVGCPFCASGLGGLSRNLEAHEILEQFVLGRDLGPLSRSVVMGIGEPLLNSDNLIRALGVVSGEMGLGARRITVSTVGFPDRVRRIAESGPRFELAISLHTPDDEQRAELVPAMRGTPIEDVLAAGDAWFDATGREVTYEYALLAGVNDTPGHAERLAERLARRRCSVNLIAFNPSPDLPFERPDAARVEAFRGRLAGRGIVATVRASRGLEEDAACGQLRLRGSGVVGHGHGRGGFSEPP